ncbi:ABC transporter permease [Helicobacter pametensis]|uniref:ABC transporter permease n=1 Tax=Helicobacter pametensis TaxID=95149 RepID=UPI0004B717FD|nr:ABC transporter permease [Helicobacter pametensis]
MIKAFKDDLLSLAKSPFSLFILLIPMPLIAILLFFTLGHGILQKMPIGILDLDQTSTSNQIIFSLQASPSLHIEHFYTSLDHAKNDLQNAKIFALIVLPHNLQSNSKKGITSSIPLYYNAQFLLVAKTLQSKILQIIGVENVKLKLAKNLVESKNFLGALSKSLPISQQITALYNPDSSYAQFLLTAILPCSLAIFICVSLLCSILRDPRTSFFVLPKGGQTELFWLLFAKIFNTACFSFLWWLAMMWFFTHIMHLPMRGDWNTLALGAFLMILAYEAITLFIFALAKDSTRSISVISIYSAPSFAFAGITFPTNSMESFSKFWSDLLPVSHYLELYIQQANYGGSLAYALSLCLSMTPFLLFGLLGLVIYGLRSQK